MQSNVKEIHDSSAAKTASAGKAGKYAKNANNRSATLILQRNFPVLGLSCASCAGSVESTVKHLKGILQVSVNFATQSAVIDFDSKQINEQEIQAAVRSVGYDLLLEPSDTAADIIEQKNEAAFRSVKRSAVFATIFSIPLIIISMWGMHWPFADWGMLILATLVIFLFGGRFFVSAYRQMLHGKAGMDTLVALSTSIAYLYSLSVIAVPGFWAAKGLPGHLYFESAAVVICFILLGKALEMKAKGRTTADIKKLMSSQPAYATLIEAGQNRQVPVGDIQPGNELLVRPGESIAVDGTLLSGQPFINESMITGEPVAVEKSVSDKLYAGTINTHSSFTMTATQVGSATTLSAIIRLVKEAQGSKAPIQRLVDKIAARFVIVVLIIAVFTFLSWWLIGGSAQISRAILAMVSVLVIACPCALGLATPAAIMVGIGRGASMGILIKDAAHLQKLAAVTDIVLDKTGTITTGKPTVQATLWLNQHTLYKSLLCAIEQRAQHPLSEAVVNHLEGMQKDAMGNQNTAHEKTPSPSLETTFLPGLGLHAVIHDPLENALIKKTNPPIHTDYTSAEINGALPLNDYYVGNEKLMQQYNIAYKDKVVSDFEALHQGDTIIYFGTRPVKDNTDVSTKHASAQKGTLLGVLAIADTLKQDATDTIKKLHQWHIQTHLLSGDTQQAVARVATKTNIQHAFGGLLPQDKLDYIQQLKSAGKTVAMVGDGINDSAALAGADISIALSAGSAIAMEVAGMTLVGHQLSKIPQGIILSKMTNKTIKGNLFWAFIYNLIGIPVAAGILYPVTHFMLDPMIAGGAMALSSISVLMSSLRLRYRKL